MLESLPSRSHRLLFTRGVITALITLLISPEDPADFRTRVTALQVDEVVETVQISSEVIELATWLAMLTLLA